jgi:hypothetical protein
MLPGDAVLLLPVVGAEPVALGEGGAGAGAVGVHNHVTPGCLGGTGTKGCVCRDHGTTFGSGSSVTYTMHL